METVEAKCTFCNSALQFPRISETVSCARCGSTYQVFASKSAVSLIPLDKLESEGDGRPIDLKIEELDRQIEEVGASIEDLKSREQAAPLQAGCALFGVFGLTVFVIALFVTIGRAYFGGWLFYTALAITVFVGIWRASRRLMTRNQVISLRTERAGLERRLEALQAERDRIAPTQ